MTNIMNTLYTIWDILIIGMEYIYIANNLIVAESDKKVSSLINIEYIKQLYCFEIKSFCYLYMTCILNQNRNCKNIVFVIFSYVTGEYNFPHIYKRCIGTVLQKLCIT